MVSVLLLAEFAATLPEVVREQTRTKQNGLWKKVMPLTCS
jgi:hypothetical protein